MASAGPMPCVGTKPICRAACESRQPAMSDRAQPSDCRLAGRPLGEREERVARAAGAVGVEEPALGCRGLFGIGQLVGLSTAACA